MPEKPSLEYLRGWEAGFREALAAVITEDRHPMPVLPPPDAPRLHGPCHPSDMSRQCAAHRVRTRLDAAIEHVVIFGTAEANPFDGVFKAIEEAGKKP